MKENVRKQLLKMELSLYRDYIRKKSEVDFDNLTVNEVVRGNHKYKDFDLERATWMDELQSEVTSRNTERLLQAYRSLVNTASLFTAQKLREKMQACKKELLAKFHKEVDVNYSLDEECYIDTFAIVCKQVEQELNSLIAAKERLASSDKKSE